MKTHTLEKHILQTEVGDINVYVKDNHAAWTILFIHGFNSSHAFAENIYGLENNFNIVTFDYPRISVKFDNLVKIADEISEKLLKGKKFIYLGHSLGGAINLSVTNNSRVAKRILVAPLNPSLANASSYERFEKIMKPVGAMQAISSKITKKGIEIVAKINGNKLAGEFVNEESEFKHIMDNHILNRDFLEKHLRNLYLTKPATYIIGDEDGIIPTELFVDFCKTELNSEVNIVSGSKHNPFKDNPKEMHELLNKVVPFKKRFFLSRFFTTKNLKK